MIIYLGSDHGGFQLKEYLKTVLKDMGYEVSDLGNLRYEEQDDYPDFAEKVAERVRDDYENARGILICRGGAGVCIVANKFPRVRAALAMTSDQAFDSRNDDDTNILCLAADYIDYELAKKIAVTWIKTPFAREERFRRRINKIDEIERKLKGNSDENH